MEVEKKTFLDPVAGLKNEGGRRISMSGSKKKIDQACAFKRDFINEQPECRLVICGKMDWSSLFVL